MPNNKFKDFERGAIIQHESTADSYVVTANYGSRCVAVRTVDITNPDEWKLASTGKDKNMFPIELKNRIKQYQELVNVAPDESQQIRNLVTEEEWTQEGAERLVSLAHDYGYWFLLHAAGLAIAAGIEDGRLNY